jgi:multidrug efflux pump subunit AcrA (membrane-fusion protein)
VTRTTWTWIAGVLAGILVLGGAVARFGLPRSPGGSPDPASRPRPVPVVAVGHPRYAEVPRALQLTASVSSLAQAVIVSKTTGYLQEVTVRPGDVVRAGQVVAVVDHAQLDAQLAQAQAALAAAQAAVQTAQAQVAAAHAQRLNAEAQLASAEASVVKAQAQLRDAEATYRRIATLAQQGAVAAQNLDDATAQVVSARATLDAARAQVAQAQAQVQAARQQESAAASQVRTAQAQAATQAAAVENARLALQNATITAPFSGVVVSRTLDPGAFVTPGTSTPILTIADLDRLDVVVNVTESDLSAVHRGAPVTIQVDAYPGRTFRGVVSRIAGGVDPVTRTAQVEVDLANPGHLLRPGMYATVTLMAGRERTLVVPLSALVTVGNQHYVWLVVENRVTQQPVTIGRTTGEFVEITSGVTPHDLIVVRGTDLLREGQAVRGVPSGP